MELLALYELVPAAEEEDLLEEVAASRVRQEWERLLRHGRCLSCWYLADSGAGCCAVPEADDTAEETDDEAPLTSSQVLGLVQHRLGGVVVSTEHWGWRPPDTTAAD